MASNRILVALLLLLSVRAVFADFVQDCESAYNIGNLSQLKTLIDNPVVSDAEKACAAYYKALLAPSDQKAKLQVIFESYPGTHYGKLALLEVAKINFFEREYNQAETALKGLKDSGLVEKSYWEAKNYERLGKYNLAVSSAQVFISQATDSVKIESTWFTIASAQMNKGDYSTALKTLDMMRNSVDISNIPLLWLKIGECQEKLGNLTMAINAYRKIMNEYRYTQYCYTAEDRLHQLDDQNKADVDVTSFTTFDTSNAQKPAEPEPIPDNALKYYLQVGAFGTQDNADRYKRQMITAGYPSITFTKIVNSKQLYVVATGPYRTKDEALDIKQKLSGEQINSLLIQRY